MALPMCTAIVATHSNTTVNCASKKAFYSPHSSIQWPTHLQQGQVGSLSFFPLAPWIVALHKIVLFLNSVCNKEDN